MKVVIIGGGPAGMMAAISCKKNNPSYDVVIIEKNNTLGKKLLITGKGRCNITSSLEISEHIKNIPGNGMFMFSSFLPNLLFFSNITTLYDGLCFLQDIAAIIPAGPPPIITTFIFTSFI